MDWGEREYPRAKLSIDSSVDVSTQTCKKIFAIPRELNDQTAP